MRNRIKSLSSEILLVCAAFCAAIHVFPDDTAPQDAELTSIARTIEDAQEGYLKVPPGIYRIGSTISIKGRKNLVIDGSGSKIVVTKHVAAFRIADSENLTLKGFTIDYDPLTFTQATVSSLDPSSNTARITIHKGYPDIDQFQNQGTAMVFSPGDRLWKRDSYGFLNVDFSKVSPGVWNMRIKGPKDNNLASGDLIVVERRNVAGMNIDNSKDVTLKDMTWHSSPGIAMYGRYCTGKQIIDNVRISRGEKPEGAIEERLYSTGADGINYAFCRQGPVVTNCDFGFMGDDAINFHGEILPVFSVESPNTATIMFPRKGYLQNVLIPGDKAQILESGSFAVASEGVLESMESAGERTDIPKKDIVRFYPSREKSTSEGAKMYFFRIKFKENVKLSPGQWLEFPALNCPGFVVMNNFFHDNRARGLRIMGSDGIIAGNTFERIGQSAISIGAEYNYWREAGWCRNVAVVLNTIKDCGIHSEATYPGAYACGAICVFTFREKGNAGIFTGHENIIISSNIIEGSSSAGIHAYGVKGLIISGNILDGTMSRDCSKTGSSYGLKVDSPVTFHDCQEVLLDANSIK